MDETKHPANPVLSQVEGPDPIGQGYETRDLSLRAVVMFGIGLFVLSGVTLLLMGGMFNYFAARRAKFDVPPSPLAETRPPPPGPRLQVNPTQELKELQAAEEAVLNSYAWVDREGGRVRIPIDRAMELLAERGLPVRAGDRVWKIEDRRSRMED